MNQRNLFVSPNSLSGRLGIKDNLYQILDVDLKTKYIQFRFSGTSLPSYDNDQYHFLGDTFAKKKLALNH